MKKKIGRGFLVLFIILLIGSGSVHGASLNLDKFEGDIKGIINDIKILPKEIDVNKDFLERILKDQDLDIEDLLKKYGGNSRDLKDINQELKIKMKEYGINDKDLIDTINDLSEIMVDKASRLKEEYEKLDEELIRALEESKNNPLIKNLKIKLDKYGKNIKEEEIQDLKEELNKILNKEGKYNLSDIKSGAWFYDDVIGLIKRGGISGYKDGTFRPQANISAGEFIKLSLTSINGKDYPLIQDAHWGLTYYKEAIKQGIIKEGDFLITDDFFNSPISREDMAYIIMNLNEKVQGEEIESTDGIKDLISDYENIGKDRQTQVLQAYKKGILRGKSDKFDPQGLATRAEAAAIVMRALEENRRIK